MDTHRYVTQSNKVFRVTQTQYLRIMTLAAQGKEFQVGRLGTCYIGDIDADLTKFAPKAQEG